MGVYAIAAYRPHAGKATMLLECVRDHMPVLREQGLITDRPAHVMRAKDGTIVEVFEWQSGDAIERAHSNAAVRALWERFGQASDYVPIGTLPECSDMFANFEAVDV
ncbi:MAG: hypothetical protein JO293_07615 [Candidatus Eremiobacteraeota bacterium]|nr:hypothetical protein [Candidatus Eremiobacteraeota bacterium]MBV8223215.1 hypothetical protein [Candidatus Eremiobacteraeota bacterium]MBV8280751.1 hypothetical protein [Candidatus Eremiobacteraeota bacterium]